MFVYCTRIFYIAFLCTVYLYMDNCYNSVCVPVDTNNHMCRVPISPPTPPPQARLDILRIHSRKMNLTRGINLRKVAEAMPGMSSVCVHVHVTTEKVAS